MNYKELLNQSAEGVGNVVCMGLDVKLACLPESNDDLRTRINAYFHELFRRMNLEGVSPAAFKPNIGYYAALDRPRDEDFSGSLALGDIFDMLESFFPGIPVILDSKRGDIAVSSSNYAFEAFDCWQSDAVTVSPYMGSDSVLPFAREGKGIYILNRTSNPGGADFQNMTAIDPVDEKELYPFYIAVAHRIALWNQTKGGIGAVVGATNMQELSEIATYYSDKDVPLLIPGVGSQGGSASAVMSALRSAGYPVNLARINSSSALTHPWKNGPAPDDHLILCMNSLKALIKECAL